MINICYTQADCTNAGGNWNGVTCQYLPVTYVVTDYIKPSGTLVIRYYSDYDGDGYGTGDYQEVEVHPGEDWYISAELMAITGDCNDSDSLVYSNISCSYNGSVCVDYDFCGLACPEVPVEICGNGVDEDCDGVADEGCGECHEADTSGDCDGVDTGELGEYLERWARGEVSMGDVLGAVGVWRG